ncbi:hypothetical protein [Bacillus phage DZ1]|uniref:Uncharacterized protein n=1 Tax=Bacillus phage DZ1 TaxID=3075862 RepID=A0AA96IXC6_9CAUD|nr:hypothetical protein [Bacillus phage DZ1]
MERSLAGKTVEHAPFCLTLYELCAKFHQPPSVILNEDNRIMEELLVVHNAVNRFQENEAKKQESKAKRGDLKAKYGGGAR